MINDLQSTKRREEKRREEKRREEKRREEKRREEKRREEKRREEKRREEKRKYGQGVRGCSHRLHADKKTIQFFQRWLEQMADVLAYKHKGKCSHTCKTQAQFKKLGQNDTKSFPAYLEKQSCWSLPQ